ncbi:MAG: hypothetical protein IKE15_05185 [Clostridia bacterium]|nr:hypothetical protein [Clostridia bacterium]
MKKALTPILAVVAVIAIVVACVFGAQNGSNKSKLDETTAALNAANDSVKTLEDEKAKLSADLEAAKADLEAKASELETKVSELTAKAGEFDTAKADLEAKVAELEQKLTKTERALTAAKSNAYIMFASADWSVSNWGTADSDDDTVKVTPAAVSGPGDYTVGLEFAQPVSGLAFTALGVKNGEIDFPGYYLRVNEIRINGEKISWLEDKIGYTSSDDGKETRVNIYNEWVSELPADARVWNGDKAHAAPVFVDKAAFDAVKTYEVDFTVFDGPTDYAYIMYANADWTASNWGITDSEDGNVKVTAPEIRGAGDYTTSIEFATPAAGLAFTALGVVNGEISFPGWYLTIREIRVNGEKIDFLADKKGYTSSDEGITTRVNLYNEWVSEVPGDARSLDGDLANASPIVVDKAAFESVSKFEIDFNYSPISAYIMYANADWSVSNWGYTSTDAVKVAPATLLGEGSYTTSLEFAEPAEGLAFTALGIKNGEQVLPGWIIRIDSIRLNDSEENILKGIPYTSSDDEKETRSNIYNEWVTDLPKDARTESGNLDNASPVVVDKALFTGVKKMTVDFTLIKGREVAAAAADENALTREKWDELKANGFNAYIGVQSTSYIFRNTWDEAKYGRDSQDNPECFGQLTGWDADNNKVNYGGTFADTKVTDKGEYTVSLTTGEMGFGSDETFRMLFVSTEIPSAAITQGYTKIDNVRVKIGNAATQTYTDVDTSGDYARIILIDEYNRGEAPFGYTVPGADSTITVNFEVTEWQ